jgi:hypothetical protein
MIFYGRVKLPPTPLGKKQVKQGWAILQLLWGKQAKRKLACVKSIKSPLFISIYARYKEVRAG